MSNTIGQFDFTVLKMSKNDYPHDPIVVIDLKSWVENKTGGAPGISPHLMTETEIDTHIALLKADLDALAPRAKKALRQAKKETLEMVSKQVAKKNDRT